MVAWCTLGLRLTCTSTKFPTRKTVTTPAGLQAILLVTIYTSGSLSLITLPLYSLAVQVKPAVSWHLPRKLHQLFHEILMITLQMGSDHKHHLVKPHHKHKVQEVAAEKAAKEAKEALKTAKPSLT